MIDFSSLPYVPYSEPQALDVIPHVNFAPSLLLDCGVGYGHEAHHFRKRWPDMWIIGLEPALETFKRMGPTYPGTLIRAGAWSKSGLLWLHDCHTEMGASFVHNHSRKEENSQQVVVKALDDLLIHDTPLGHCMEVLKDIVLWADVEGAELDVLKGATQLLNRRAIRLMNLEVHDGEVEREVDEVCQLWGFEKILSYAGNGSHHDNVYRLREEQVP